MKPPPGFGKWSYKSLCNVQAPVLPFLRRTSAALPVNVAYATLSSRTPSAAIANFTSVLLPVPTRHSQIL